MDLRTKVDATPEGIIRLQLSDLATAWRCSRDEAERILCTAAVGANLAVGIVDGCFCDVMTVEEAQAVLKEQDQDQENHERPLH